MNGVGTMIRSEQPVKSESVDENEQNGWLTSFFTKKNGAQDNGFEGMKAMATLLQYIYLK